MIAKRIIKIVIIVIVAIAVLFGGYVLYLSIASKRIPDEQKLDVHYLPSTEQAALAEGNGASVFLADMKTLQKGKKYKATTFNIGFGAYDHKFSFFMDVNKMQDGTDTKGVYSRARSLAAERKNTAGSLAVIKKQDPDIMLFQEADVSADRSYGVDQVRTITDGWRMAGGPACYSFAVNMHTGYLFYPPTKPIGRVKESGLLTISKYRIASSVRRQLPVSGKFPDKFFDLDRCFSVSRLPVQAANGKREGELTLINIHASAYDKGGVIRAEQMKMLKGVMTDEYAKGNWVIVGGDFNHALFGTETLHMGRMQIPPWVQAFDVSMIPEGFSLLRADNIGSVLTCRDTSIPYEKGTNYEVTIDGFMVSDNVAAASVNIDNDFRSSDHNPVELDFTLE